MRGVEIVLVAGLGACTAVPIPAVREGTVLHLTIVATSPRSVTPEREAAIGPVSDTGLVTLRVERVRGDSSFGHYTGPALSFWPGFRGLNSTFVIVRHGAEWHIELDHDAQDAGMKLSGEEAGGRVQGRWTGPMTGTPEGVFRLEPGA